MPRGSGGVIEDSDPHKVLMPFAYSGLATPFTRQLIMRPPFVLGMPTALFAAAQAVPVAQAPNP